LLYIEFTKVSRVLQELLELTRCDGAAVALRDALHWVLHQLCAYYNATKKSGDVSVSREDELKGFVWSVSSSGGKNGSHPDVLVAVNLGDVGRLRQLLKKDPNCVDRADSDGRTGLMHCCRYTSPSQMKCAKVLLHKNADINHQDFGNSSLFVRYSCL
jgi:ankyrin repeat protein